ncbi:MULTISPECIES: hypothetical protein [Cyanophyceae]|uniref:hypothetical protein n=1 Tax=Cyanophyceae TaxID=3028117 RepID=UPI0018EFA60A|nr:hypothetical protein [Trichocoleus sp. FACHB-69]
MLPVPRFQPTKSKNLRLSDFVGFNWTETSNEFCLEKANVSKLCRDQAREELILIMGAGAAAGVIDIPFLFAAGMTFAEIAVVNRIARIYDVDVVAAGGASALAGAVMVGGGADALYKIAVEVSSNIPLISKLIKPALGAGAIWSFGEAAIAYFETQYPSKLYSSNTNEVELH